MARTFVIAEIGSCHDGELVSARALVQMAAACGADAVKAQFWSDPDRLADRRRVPAHYRDIYRRYRMPVSWLPILKAEADAAGIEFLCTAYLPEDVAVVAPYVTRFKVASFEAGAADLREAHRPFSDRQVVVSLGMGGSQHAGKWSQDTSRVRFLHCVSAYPAPVVALHLGTLRAGARHGLIHGFSDHTDPALTWTGALAVAAGAEIIEAHLRLEDTDPENPDAPHAMTPQQFDSYVRHIRFAEACLGDGRAGMQPCEAEMAQYRVRSEA